LDKTTSKDRPAPCRDNERPLVEDIRLLGRILGDVIREQEGVDAYELVEQMRKLSVAFRRDADHEADRALKKLLKGLSGRPDGERDPRLHLFQPPGQPGRRPPPHPPPRVHERAGDTQEGSIEVAWRACAGPALRPKPFADLAAAYVSPVLTAHPTEVQRKSILDAERDIANLLTERDDIKVRARCLRAQGRAHAARAGRQRRRRCAPA
jgi:phosphoenolpyruvate carboxylase